MGLVTFFLIKFQNFGQQEFTKLRSFGRFCSVIEILYYTILNRIPSLMELKNSIKLNTIIHNQHDHKLRSPDHLPKPLDIQKPENGLPSIEFNRFISQFQEICSFFKSSVKSQPQLLETQNNIGNSILKKLDKLIDVNLQINENLQKVTQGLENKSLSPTIKRRLRSTSSLQTSETKQYGQEKQINAHLEKVFSNMQNHNSEADLNSQQNQNHLQEIVQQCLHTSPAMPMLATLSIPKLFAANSMIYPSVQSSQIETHDHNQVFIQQSTKSIGQGYIQDAEFYFRQYSQSRLNYDDMKIKFSQSMLYRMIKHSEKWINYYNVSHNRTKTSTGNQRCKLKILQVFQKSTRETLKFLINKYPPSRRKIIDTSMNERIHQIKSFSIAKYDILKNSGSQIGFNPSQTDFTKQIKLLINTLILETRKQSSGFKQKMKKIFTMNYSDENVDDDKTSHSDVDFIIGSKISQSVQLYSQNQLNIPGLQIKNAQILRILMKWVEELQSYFTETNQKILNNRFGFKTRLLEGIPIKIPRSKKQKLANHLKQMFSSQIQKQIQEHKNQMSILIFHLVNLGLSGISGYENLNNKQLAMLKLSQCLSEVLRSSVLTILNIILKQLVKIGSFYKADEVESNIQLVTFGVMDLLRCKCIGSKDQIFSIYDEIKKSEHFEIIRVKNKLNESTRDILINLKLKESFLICEVQLSLGDSVEQVNDHFCHYLYELSRSSFGVLFECANQIWNLDPRMTFIKKNANIHFKKDSLMTTRLKSKYRSADFIYCSHDHSEQIMQIQCNNKPYCCMSCATFHSAYKSWLIHLQCPTCYSSICFPCFNEMKKKNQCLMYKYLKENDQIQYINTFCLTDTYFGSIADPERIVVQMNNLFSKYKYIGYITINNIGAMITVKKKYKDTFAQAFCTIKDIPQVPLCPKLPYHWNAIFPLKNPEVKKLSDLRSYRKLNISNKWYQIQKILQSRKIQDVVCIIDQPSRSALIIDILQTEQQIQQTIIQRDIAKSVEEYNKVNCGYFELTSKGITNINFLQDIKQKNTITTLNLWENNIKDISVLKQFNSIEELYLKENNIESMQPLLEMKNLTIIGLTKNNIIGEIPKLNFPNLQLLDISDLPELTGLQNLSTSTLQSLMMIRANKTKIKRIPQLKLPNLTLLSIAFSNIEDAEQLSKCMLPELKKLCLNDNRIQGKIPKMSFPALQCLNLQNNQITDISNFENFQMSRLTTLNLCNNKIEGAVDNLNFPSLTYLDISCNKITSFRKQVLKSQTLHSLKQLNVSQNQICQLGEMSLPQVKIINMQGNKLKSISNLSISELEMLEYLDISNNMLEDSIPIVRLPSLVSLKLNNNRIQYIKNLQLSKLPQLNELDLSNNMIVDLPALQMQSLKTLNLSSNKISEQNLVDSLYLISRILEINLKNNPQQIKESIIKKRKSLQVFKLDQ